MSTLFPQSHQTLHYTISDNASTLKPTYRKVYNNIQCQYCQLVKKKIIYANASKSPKTISVTSLNQHHLKLKYSQIDVKPYSNAEIPIRMYFDHTAKKHLELVIRVDDGNAIEELVFAVELVE